MTTKAKRKRSAFTQASEDIDIIKDGIHSKIHNIPSTLSELLMVTLFFTLLMCVISICVAIPMLIIHVIGYHGGYTVEAISIIQSASLLLFIVMTFVMLMILVVYESLNGFIKRGRQHRRWLES